MGRKHEQKIHNRRNSLAFTMWQNAQIQLNRAERHHFGLSGKIWKTLSWNIYCVGAQIIINIVGLNLDLNALHEKI